MDTRGSWIEWGMRRLMLRRRNHCRCHGSEDEGWLQLWGPELLTAEGGGSAAVVDVVVGMAAALTGLLRCCEKRRLFFYQDLFDLNNYPANVFSQHFCP